MNSSSRRRPAIGLISVGQGPRPELERLHDALFKRLGLEVTITSRHALDGLSPKQLASLDATSEEPAIHCNIRDSGSAASPLGAGWRSVWISRDRLVPWIQRCIDELEKSDGVDVSICCVAEHFEAGSFHSTRPFVLPSAAMFAHAQIIAVSKPDATIGLIVHGARQRKQQEESWRRQAWAEKLDLQFSGDGGPDDAVARLAPLRPDLAMAWAYAIGFGPNDPPDRLARLAAALGAPLIAPAIAATMFARNMLAPPFGAVVER